MLAGRCSCWEPVGWLWSCPVLSPVLLPGRELMEGTLGAETGPFLFMVLLGFPVSSSFMVP